MNLEKNTPFMGLSICESGPSDLLKKAIGASASLLTIEQFIEEVNFQKDSVMNDYFWQVMVTKHSIHVDALLLRYLGYEGEFRIQQHNFKRFLKGNNIDIVELSSHDLSIENFPTIKNEMKNMRKNVIANRKWIIIDPREFKKVIMKLSTKNGDRIREYYINLEELFKMYYEYTLYFKDLESKRQISLLEKKLEQMAIDSQNKHCELMNAHDETRDQLNNLSDLIEDHNEFLPDKFLDIVKPLSDCIVKSPNENSLKARFLVMALGKGQYRISRGQTRNMARVKADNPDALILLDLPLVGAQDRMTEVRKQIRLKIKNKQFGHAVFKSSSISNLDKAFERIFLKTILDVHEEFRSIPEDIIKQARQELSISD
ncbi:hypothetical protein IIV31_093L [Armadillidium vulgare iridescent virus]|uniref:MSV199 domain-containing protein n=1 Tax=Armadillidium vulgare iridescent virus TaxID=72201 RepID=A0A068QL43_9VIRU|nr:hypothetical protein IIV31_093L [Armadillidium vulgare iridescent virus]CCV02465.1 hypothetical protein IIV31_093L [Armadillidium vulgare iridescent virus]